MNAMQEQMDNFQNRQQSQTQGSTKPKEEKKPEAPGEYIDFEEVSSK
jgi:hypothetical protein